MDKRQLLIGGAAVVVLGGAGAAWLYQYQTRSKLSDTTADLMTPSPLGENVLGKEDAPVTIIEYASTTCPHCAAFHEKTFPELKKRFIDTGKVRFIFREFPLNEVDFMAYMLTRCISKDKFFPLLEVLFQQQEKWAVQQPIPPLMAIAKQVGFTDESFEACRKDKKVFDGVAWSADQGSKLGVRSTPTFFINGTKHTGAISIDEIDKAVAALIKS